MTIKASGIITLARIDNGSIGPAGVGVSAITGEFYLSTSKTAQSGASWVTTPPAWSSGKYLWTRYKIVYTNGSTSYTTPHCSSEWEAINEIQVGGRNLIKNTSKDMLYINQKPWIFLASESNTTRFNLNEYVGETLTLRVWIDNPSARCRLQLWFDQVGWGAGEYIQANQSGYSKMTVKVPNNITKWNLVMGNDNPNEVLQFGYCKLKAELGNTATDWSPAPEDTQDQIDQANINISNKVDQNAYDTDQATIWGSINGKMDDAEFRAFQSTMNALKSSYEGFVGEGGRFEKELQNATAREQAIVQELGAKVQQLNFINTYIRESEEGLLIGAKNSPMQMLLSKDSLSFMDGGQVVAYFSNQSFYINRGAVVESLQVGVHKLTKVGNEHTVIQYIPQ